MEDVMSKQCEFCGKKPQTGNYVSHSNIKTKRVFNPNLQNVRHQLPALRRGYETRCPQGRLVPVSAAWFSKNPRLSAAGDFFAF